MPARLFRFAQVEVPWALGPADGRYVVRRHAGEEPGHVVVLATLGAPQRRLLRGRRPTAAPAEPGPAAVATGRATVIAAHTPLESREAAAAWLKAAEPEEEAGAALSVLNGVLHAQRIAAADPYGREVGRRDVLALRIGWGEGEQVAEGRWAEALELPLPSGPRRGDAALRPQERLAALLGGRDAALAAEALTLRARADLDAGRTREAALQLAAALEAALAELAAWRGRGGLAERLDELTRERDAVAAASAAALRGGVDEAHATDVGRVLERLEAALRARTAAGLD